MQIQIQNIQKAKDTVLSSSFYPMDEKFDIIRHKFTNYDQLASKLEVEFKNNRMERTRHYKVLVTNTALEIAKVIGCHPVEIYQPRSQIVLRWYVNESYNVKMYAKEDQLKINIPFEYYNENVRAIQVNVPGSHVDGEVYLFDIPKVKKWSSMALDKYCYCTASKSFKKKMSKTLNGHPLVSFERCLSRVCVCAR